MHFREILIERYGAVSEELAEASYRARQAKNEAQARAFDAERTAALKLAKAHSLKFAIERGEIQETHLSDGERELIAFIDMPV